MELRGVNNTEKNKVELDISIPAAQFNEEVSKVFRREAAKITVPGFRKGKAPRSIIEKMYGKGVFYEDAVNALLPDAIDAAVKEAGISPVSRAEVDVKSMDDGVSFTAAFFVKPEVSVRDYKGIEAVREVPETTDAAVDREIESERARNARSITVEGRPAKEGDHAVFDYEGYCEGEAFEGGQAEKYRLKLGSGRFIPGFEEQIVGKSVGEAFDVDLTFPEEYHSEELAGKPATFKCFLHELQEEQLPELDDEFAKDVSDFNTFAEYKAEVRARQEKRNADAADRALEEKLADGIIAGLDADIPEIMFQNEVENELENYERRLRSQGIDLKMFMQYTGETEAKLRERFLPGAQRQVKLRLALEAIAAAEGIEPSADEVTAEFESIAKAYNLEADKIREQIDEKVIADDIKVKKALEFVKANAKITDTVAKAPAFGETGE